MRKKQVLSFITHRLSFTTFHVSEAFGKRDDLENSLHIIQGGLRLSNRRWFFIISGFLFFMQTLAFASHLKIENITLDDVNAKEKWARVQFDISWDNAWKNDVNCDGVWLFAKYRISEGNWQHVTLKADASTRLPDPDFSRGGDTFDYSDHTPTNFSKGHGGQSAEIGMWIPETKKGAFIFRTEGSGNVSSNDVQLVWDYGEDDVRSDQLAKPAPDFSRVKVFGIEMVYVPEGKYYVGDPRGKDGLDNCFYTYPEGGAYLIDSPEAITVDAKEGSLYCDQDNVRSRDDVPFVIPETFPNAYKAAFWCMKYELSSQQYVDFLNTLSRKQQNARTETDISPDSIDNYYVMSNTNTEYLRQSVVCAKRGNGTKEPITFYTYAPARACNFMSWGDISAYADWAGLRPITELEYEKACRGPNKAVPGELAWGTSDIGRVDTFDGADGSGYEKTVPATGIVNCCYHGGIAPFKQATQKIPDNPGFEGPVSCGLFENSPHKDVPKGINDGAGYYGIMELSGNLWERCVTVGHPRGRNFVGTHGDGNIDKDGYANVSDWPDRTGAGGGNRGGVWSSPHPKYLAVSLRFAANMPRVKRGKNSGCRLGF